MAAKSWYLTATTSGGWRTIDEATQAAATNADGWVVGTGSTNHAAYYVGVERASTVFTATTDPDGTLDTTNKDAFRTTNAYTGTFANANWTFTFNVCANTSATGQDGRIRFRLIKADADGSNATEITAAQQQGGLITDLITNPGANSALTFNPGSFSITNQYLFVQIAWERTGAATMSTADVNWRTGSSASAGTRIVSADFSATYNGTATLAGTGGLTANATVLAGAVTHQGSATLAGAGSFTANGLIVDLGTGTLAGAGSFSASSVLRLAGDASLAGAGGLIANATVSTAHQGSATLAGVGSLAVDATVGAATNWEGSAALAGAGSLTAFGSQTLVASATYAGTGALTVSGALLVPGVASLAGAGSLSVSALAVQVGSATLSGVGSLTATAATLGRQDGSATLAGVGSLTVDARPRLSGFATLAGVGSLDAQTLQILQANVAMAGVGGMYVDGTVPGQVSANNEWLITARRRGRR